MVKPPEVFTLITVRMNMVREEVGVVIFKFMRGSIFLNILKNIFKIYNSNINVIIISNIWKNNIRVSKIRVEFFQLPRREGGGRVRVNKINFETYRKVI